MNKILQNIIRVGIVSSHNPENATVKVIFPDKDNTVSYDLSVLMAQTEKNKDYFIPDIGEQVLCLFLPNGIEEGFVIGSIYSNKNKPPVTDANKRHIKFEDGTWVEYDRGNSTLTVSAVGDIKIISATNINIEGNVSVDGNITATGTIIDTLGNSNNHTHY